MRIPHGEILGLAENYEEASATRIDEKKINSLLKEERTETIDKEKLKFLKENMNFKNIPDEFKRAYEAIILTNHHTFSKDKSELGWSNLVEHEIALKKEDPVYVKQFKIPEMHMNEVQKHLQEWLKLGIIETCRSKYNSPLFLVAKKDGGLRIVQDFRALNENTHVDKYSMHDVNECVAEIGRAGSTIFTTLDLTSGFWQMALQPRSRPYTAFTIPGKGQFQWKVAPMGLLGSPASFQRLVETALKGINNVIVYIDDLLIHSHSHQEHLKSLDQVFKRLAQHGLKVNFKKCEFASQEVSYLGFRLTPEGIKPGTDKLKAVKDAKIPSSLKEIRQFMGLCNFFRNHVKNFSLISGPLTALTKKDSGWRRGELPPKALQAFKELQTILCSEPVVDYPRRNRPYSLITDAACGDEANPGGLGAILTQTDEEGNFRVIGYASRKLVKHEKNYTPFLLEMQAAIWGMDHFDTYLKGRHFTLYTDHKPLEKLGKIHTKTLNRLQEAMNIYDFKIVYKKGDEMPADFLSRNTVANISWENQSIFEGQQRDSLINDLYKFLKDSYLPDDTQKAGLIKKLAKTCFIDNDIVWKRLEDVNLNRIVLFAPNNMRQAILSHAHGSLLTGHEGIHKTKQRILCNYYWPNIDKDVIDYVESCHKCQLIKHRKFPIQALLKPLPQCSEINQRVHADLFGPLKTSGNNKKYILCMTDAFSKYVELIALPDKEAVSVAQGIFHRWLCRFGSPLIITTDGGKEFTAKVCKELYKVMEVEHFTTSPYHPQCNSQAEVVNKTIAKYLATVVDSSTLDWELYLAPLMFAYNTSIHRATKFSPFKLTFGVEPRLPGFVTPDVNRTFYGENPVDEMQNTLKYTRQLAFQNNEVNRQHYKDYFDSKVRANVYTVGQKVLLNEFNFLHKNRKLAPKYSGPHSVTKVLHDTNVELKLLNGRKVVVHVNRLKPYVDRVGIKDDIPFTSPLVPLHDASENHETSQDNSPAAAAQPKRPRGRPKKLISPTFVEEGEGCPIVVQNKNKQSNTFMSEDAQKMVNHSDKNLQKVTNEVDNNSKTVQNCYQTKEMDNSIPNNRITRSEAQRLTQAGQTVSFEKLNKIKALKKKKNQSVFKKQSERTYQKKNGTSTNRLLQEAMFKKTGDIWGPKSHSYFTQEDENLSDSSEYTSADEDENDVGGDSEGTIESGSNTDDDANSTGEFFEFDENPFEGMGNEQRISEDNDSDSESDGQGHNVQRLSEEDRAPPVPPKLRGTTMEPKSTQFHSKTDLSASNSHLAPSGSKETNQVHPSVSIRNPNEEIKRIRSRSNPELDKILQEDNDPNIRQKRQRMGTIPLKNNEDKEITRRMDSTDHSHTMGTESHLSSRPPNKREDKRDVITQAQRPSTRSNSTAPPIWPINKQPKPK